MPLKLVVRVDDFGEVVRFACGVGGFGLAADFGHRKPVVFVWLIGDPGWQGHAEMVAERRCVTLVEIPQVAEALIRLVIAANADAALTEQFVELLVSFGRQAVRDVRRRCQGEDLREVYHRMSGHRES